MNKEEELKSTLKFTKKKKKGKKKEKIKINNKASMAIQTN